MIKKSKKNSTEGHFSEFVDEGSPDQMAQIQKSWRKKAKQQKNMLYLRILIIAGIIVATIFAVTLTVFIDNKKSHTILDQDQDGFTVVQTVFPHLKVLVSNQVQTYQTKMVKGLGVVFAGLVSWIEANIVSNQKVLYVPNQKAGTNFLGMALAYNLRSAAGGKLDILVQTEAYKQITLKNADIMKNFRDEQISINFIEKPELIGSDYDLLLVQNNQFLQSAKLEKFGKVIEVKKQKWDSAAIESYFSEYSKYQIQKGSTNEQSLSLGQFNSYSLLPIKDSPRQDYKTVLILQKSDQTLNLCPENIQYFKGATQKRNLIEYLRNKTLNTNQFIFYLLDDTHTLKTLTQLSNIKSNYITGSDAEQAIISEKSPYTSSKNHIYIIQFANYSKFLKKLKGNTLLLVKTEKEASEIARVLDTNRVKIISPFNNNGCLYPPPTYPFKQITPFRPFFLQSTQL